MKKFFYLIALMILFHLAPAKAQWVTIPDANFANKLQQLFPNCMNGNQMDTTCPQVVNATSLVLNAIGVSDITGIQYFDNLLTLDCFDNMLHFLPPLPLSLTELECGNNQLDSLPSLPPSLTYLGCFSNQINSLPALPNSLNNLFCKDNQITSLPPLPASLTNLNCDRNQLSFLPVLPPNLILLSCEWNQLTTLPSLPSTITELRCGDNQLSILPALPFALEELHCQYNQLTSIPALPPNLNFLDCRSNQINNLPALPTTLTFLECSWNQLNALPSLPASLSALICQHNQITSLPALPAILDELFCNNNQLASVPPLPAFISYFMVNNNNINCFENLPQIPPNGQASILNNPVTCVPNQTNYSLNLPLCLENDTINNPNNCSGIANIIGNVYSDLNSDCNFNLTDWPTNNVAVELFDSQNNLLTTAYTINGVYSFSQLQADTFVVKIDDVTLPFSLDCGQVSSQMVVLDSANQSIFNVNFPVICDSAYDINVQSVSRYGWVFPGQVHTVNTNVVENVNWYNLECNNLSYSGTVSIQITGPVTFFAPANNALTPNVNANTFSYNISDFSSLTPASFGLKFLTDTGAQAGSQICVNVTLYPTPQDLDTSNNVYHFCYPVVNSYDPNMKEVYPMNVQPGYDDWFTYTIFFQNTGTAPAFNIRLSDSLDINLDVSSFEILGYSHPANVTVSGNLLTVRFISILLPDSSSDYEGSMGYFQYRIKPFPNLSAGTQIKNTAYIYFDYNAPIVTNTTQSNFQMPVYSNDLNAKESDFSIYPNPGKGLFLFRDGKIAQTIEVFNVMGELVLKQENTGQINLQGMPKGIYLARINGFFVSRIIRE